MKDKITQAVRTACRDLFSIDVEVELTRPDEQFGDFATNVALQLAKRLGKNPHDIGNMLIEKLSVLDELHEVTLAGQGFINLRLSDSALANIDKQDKDNLLTGKKIVIEYSDPNPFKPLHAGHLYTTLVGDSIARLLEKAGADVIRINFGGDVGLHVGKSMWAIVRTLGGEYPDKLNEIAEDSRSSWMGERYVEGSLAYANDKTSRIEIIEMNKKVYKFHETADRESHLAQIYWTCRQWSYDYFTKLYEQLQVVPFDRFISESEVTPLGVKTVREQLERGVYKISDGAVIFDGEKLGLHKRVFISSEGLPTYEAKDVGLSLTKWQDYNFDESIIITANEQAQYMQVVLASLRQFAPEQANRTKHLTHGLLRMAGGAKMSSRKGNIITASDVLNAAHQAGNQNGNKSSASSMLAAVKYAFIKSRIGSDVIYNPKESVALEGNSGPYLQYAHARAYSILEKSDQVTATDLDGLEADERSLLLKITEYQDIFEKSVAELMPHYICTYLYELAQKFNRFYEYNRVLGDPRENIRIQIVKKYTNVLRRGLELLGIEAPNKM